MSLINRSVAVIGYKRHVIKKYIWLDKNTSNIVLDTGFNNVIKILRKFDRVKYFLINKTVMFSDTISALDNHYIAAFY